MADTVADLINRRMPFQRKVGVRVEAIHTDGVDLVVPFDPDSLAVPDVISAGVAFLLGETAGAAILWTLFPPDAFDLRARKVEIRYLRPANFDLRARPRIADLQWETPEADLRRMGQGRVTVPVDILAPDGRPVAKVTAQYTVSRR